jgi:broad specificity phosphatase PhoE
MADKIILIRHGEIEEKYNMKFIGSTDAHLSESGRSQMRGFGPYLQSLKDVRVVHSPLSRAREAFKLMSEGTQIPGEEWAGLREIDFGKWEGLSFTEVQAQFPDSYEGFLEWNPDFTYPEGESHASLLSRVRDCAGSLRKNPAKNVVVVSHGGLLRFLICELLGLPADRYVCFRINRGTAAVIDATQPTGVLEQINYSA